MKPCVQCYVILSTAHVRLQSRASPLRISVPDEKPLSSRCISSSGIAQVVSAGCSRGKRGSSGTGPCPRRGCEGDGSRPPPSSTRCPPNPWAHHQYPHSNHHHHHHLHLHHRHQDHHQYQDRSKISPWHLKDLPRPQRRPDPGGGGVPGGGTGVPGRSGAPTSWRMILLATRRSWQFRLGACGGGWSSVAISNTDGVSGEGGF